MQLQHLKISTRLIGLSVFLLCGSLILGLVSWMTLSRTNVMFQHALEQASQVEDAVDTARKAQVVFKIQIQEWKNTLLRGHDAAAFEKYRAAFIKSGEEARGDLHKLQAIVEHLDMDAAMVVEAGDALAKLQEQYLDALQRFDPAHADSDRVVDALVKGMDREPTQKIDQIVHAVGEHAAALRQQNQQAARAQHDMATMMVLLTLVLLTVLGASMTYWVITSVTGPLSRAIQIAKTVAAGDLSADIQVSSSDETGQLLLALKEMNDGLSRIVASVRLGTDAIATGSSEIATGNLDLSSRTEQQASALEETASSMEEITATVRQNADNAQQANQLVASASEVALRGGHVVSQVIVTMDSINEASKRIVDIIAVIDGIAFQTNILALNAAVEAARAGEQGRGFAVVAAEVRGLAQRSASAAKEIKELIGNSVERVAAGGKLVTEAGTTMSEVVQSVQRVTGIMTEITAASREQTMGIEQVNTAISQMDQVTQQNAALVEQAAAAAASLQYQADELTQAVSKFKLA